MIKKFSVVALLVVAFVSRSNAGTDIVQDYGGREFNNYAPAPLPPPPVFYYAPPPVGVVVYPRIAWYGPSYRVYAYNRFGGHRRFHRFHP